MASTKKTGAAKTAPEEEKKESLQEGLNQMPEDPEQVGGGSEPKPENPEQAGGGSEPKPENPEQAGGELEPMPEEPEQTEEENLGCRVYVKAPNSNYAGTIGGISFGNGHAVFELDSAKNKHMKEWFQNNGYSVEYV